MSVATLHHSAPAPAERRPPGGSVLLRHVSWQGYITLLDEVGDDAVRMTYDEGFLEIEVPSELHERLKKLIGVIVEAMLNFERRDYEALGSTTWRREERLKGLEADECYYIANVHVLRGKQALDLSVDPAPDLAIEAEVYSPALDKMKIYAALGVRELWRVRETGDVTMYELNDAGEYQPIETSVALPRLSATMLTDFMKRLTPIGNKLHSEVVREFHDWLSKPGEA